MKTLIKNGAVVTASDSVIADVLIDGEKVIALGATLPSDDANVIDAHGKYVLPGGIDVHTHLELVMMGTVSSDDFYSGHKAAAFGGTTSHIDFGCQYKDESLKQALDNWHAKSQGKPVIDYGFHITITDPTDKVIDEIPSLLSDGITTIKLLLAYKGRLQVDDTAMFKIMQKTGEHGMLTMIHAENGDAIDILIKQSVAANRLSPVDHVLTRPHWAEAEATLRAISLAAMADASVYIVHMTSQAAVEQLNYARARGLKAMGETCPQYLFFTVDHLRRPDGAKWVCSPPFRTKSDNEFLWKALAQNNLQVVGTDHCPFFFDGTKEIQYEDQRLKIAGKELGKDNFTLIPNGVPGIEDRMLILWTYGVGCGIISMNRFVELCCTNPAKIFGMYPRKGTIAVGSDADIVIWNPKLSKVVLPTNMHQRTDYNLYEGMELIGLPEKVFVRGNMIVDGEKWLGKAGQGKFLKRDSTALVI